MSRSIRIATLIILMGPGWGAGLSAQGRLTDIVFSGGMALELYRGGIPSVTLPVVDSVDEASAASGELALRGVYSSSPNGSGGFNLRFDGGVRQFDAYGFKLRDYAPRVWTGLVETDFRRPAGPGILQLRGQARGRSVVDRTPIPLFLPPGYADYEGSALFRTRAIGGVSWDARVQGGHSDYHAQDIVPQLDLLDRNKLGVEVGALRAWNGGRQTMRVYGSFTGFWYPEQGTGYLPDPLRRDQAYQAGARWMYDGRELSNDFEQSPGITAEIGIQGTMNRSNAGRTEYNAVSLDAEVSMPMPAEISLNVVGVLTAKNYLTETEFARLIPGEEADNASRVYVEVSRFLSNTVNAAMRVGWTRAETDIGDAYFVRYSASALLRYRP